MSERTLLLGDRHIENNGLSVIFSIICIVDVFGVFPVVALPKAIIDCGFYGILIILVVCTVQIYTASLLGKCWLIAEKIDPHLHHKKRYPYSALTELTYGSTLSKFVTFLLDVTVFGGGIPNLIVASQNLQLLGQRLSGNTFDVSFCYWIVLMGTLLCPILWLGSPKDMKFLCGLSVSIVIGVFVLVTGCLLFGTAKDSIEPEMFLPEKPLWQTLLTAYGIIAFQFDIHPTILTIQVDMQNKKRLSKAIIGGFLATLLMFAIVCVVASIKFGYLVQPSILETLSSSVALHLAAGLIAIQLCLTSAVSNSALYQHMEDCLNISRDFNHKRCILRTILTILAIIIAESVPRFDLVMSLIGGTLTGPLVFILPPLFYMKMQTLNQIYEEELSMATFTNIIYNTEEESKKAVEYFDYSSMHTELTEFLNGEDRVFSQYWMKMEYIFCILIIVISIICTIAATYLNVNNAILFTNFSQPCIFNLTATLINY